MQQVIHSALILFLFTLPGNIRAQGNQNWQSIRDFGITYYEQGNYPRAIGKFAEAFRLQAKDPLTALYLGLSYEGNEEFYRAGVMYRYLATLNLPEKIKAEMQSRHLENNRKSWREEIQTNFHAKKTSFNPNPNSIAVLYFRNISRLTI